jgi:Leucine-rich repeat (LRR) protein
MKNVFYFFCLLCGVIGSSQPLQAQIVNIPDANFKAKLIALGIDTNNDGDIQVAEAQAVTLLNVSNSNISDMTGITVFVNLQQLNCNNNQLTSLDISSNSALTNLACSNNPLTSLDVSNQTTLTTLNCGNNQLTSLDVSNQTTLTNLYCGQNQLTNLDVSNNTALTTLYCGLNQLTNLDVSNNTALTNLYCGQNQLTNLDVSNNTALTSLDFSFNQLTSLDVSNHIALNYLDFEANQLTSLDVSNNIALTHLVCTNNQLTSLDVSNNTALTQLVCTNNQLTSLDVSNNVNLSNLYCTNNDLHYLMVKNGKFETFYFAYNPNLNYICVDSMQLADVQNKLQQYGMTNVFVSILCTYAPGGISYNIVSGQSFVDLDMNGCAPNDSTVPLSFISINDGPNTYYTCSNQVGNYLAYLDSGSYSLTPQVPNSSYFTTSTAVVSFPNNNNNVQTQDLCITPNGVFPDVEISLIPLNPARPGFDANYQIHYKNIGTTTANGDITLDFQGNKMNFVSASVSPMNQTASQLTWNYNNLQPFETRTMDFKMHILPPPTNNINDVITFHANISLANDADSSNNNASVTQTLVGSFDPNDKTCLEGKLLYNDKIGDYLHYLIRFQNTGNYPAENVVVIDTLDAAKYDLASLQILETSHNAHIDLKSNVLQFYFENIQLADSFSNEPESHGFVVYKIKTKSTIPLNSVVKNKAEIYFDYNFPVITNLETTTFSSFTGIEYPAQKPHFQLTQVANYLFVIQKESTAVLWIGIPAVDSF